MSTTNAIQAGGDFIGWALLPGTLSMGRATGLLTGPGTENTAREAVGEVGRELGARRDVL